MTSPSPIPPPAPSTNLTILNPRPSDSEIPRYTIWFDIDNTLYSKKCRIDELMTEKIQQYFYELGLPMDEATDLHNRYYKEYGLAIRGLVRHHDVDPLDYDRRCDSSLPLEEVLSPDPKLRQLLLAIDRSKARVWCITNAYKTHAARVLKLLAVDDLIEGIVSCDYTNKNFHCKPEKEFYEEALQVSQPSLTNPRSDPTIIRSNHLLVDDSYINIIGATQFGFGSAVLFDEDHSYPILSNEPKFERISDLEQLKELPVWKDCILSSN